MKKTTIILSAVFFLALIIRFLSVWPANTIVGFDQARDLFAAREIYLNHDLRIIGPTAGNNANLHHGVAWLYFLVPPLLLGGGNPIWAVLWNGLFNAATCIVIFLLTKDLFKSKGVGYLAALLTAFSAYYIQFAGWLSNPTVTLLTVPVFIYGLWQYSQNKSWGLPLAAFFLGLTIQFELFFIYLIPVGVLIWFILKPKFPSLKLFFISLLSLIVSLSTMIATEIKFHFAGVRSILTAGQLVGGTNPTFDFLKLLPLNLLPQAKTLDLILGTLAVVWLIYEIIKIKETRKRNLFLLIWFFSPATMLILGVHNAPWFLIGRPAAAIIIGAYLISKLRFRALIAAVTALIIFTNIQAVRSTLGKGQPLLEPDPAAILSTQEAVMHYTYQKAQGQAFAIDSVTNPLYINAVWAWNYEWYGKTLGSKPNWLGGDQLPPYNTLTKVTGKEKYLFLIIDETPRIPPVYTQNAVSAMEKRGKLIEEKEFTGLKVMTFTR